MESRYGFAIDYDKMTPSKAQKMLKVINESMSKVQNSTAAHSATNDPRYMEMKMVAESLNKYMKDYKPANAPEQKSSPKMQEIKASVTAKSVVSEMSQGRTRALVERAMDLASQGKAVPARYMDAFAPLMALIKESKVITEGEMAKSEVILAANSMVDKMQDMQEDLGRMINEELPPLTDSIRDEMGSDQAAAFSSSTSEALNGLLTSVTSAREAMSGAARSLSGEEVADMEMPSDDLGATADMGDDLDTDGVDADLSDLDADIDDLETDGFDATDAAVGGQEEMGREER